MCPLGKFFDVFHFPLFIEACLIRFILLVRKYVRVISIQLIEDPLVQVITLKSGIQYTSVNLKNVLSGLNLLGSQLKFRPQHSTIFNLFVRGYRKSLQVNVNVVPEIRPPTLSFTSLSQFSFINHALIQHHIN
jgi:hypothetical protein